MAKMKGPDRVRAALEALSLECEWTPRLDADRGGSGAAVGCSWRAARPRFAPGAVRDRDPLRGGPPPPTREASGKFGRR